MDSGVDTMHQISLDDKKNKSNHLSFNFEKLEESEIFVSSHFRCVCSSHEPNDESTHKDYLVSVCEQHPLFTDITISFSCSCYKLTSSEICQNCKEIRYLLNFLVKKVCLGKIP